MNTLRLSALVLIIVVLCTAVFLVASRKADATCVDGTTHWTLAKEIRQDTLKLDSLIAHPHGLGFIDSVDAVIIRGEVRMRKIETYRKCLNLWSN